MKNYTSKFGLVICFLFFIIDSHGQDTIRLKKLIDQGKVFEQNLDFTNALLYYNQAYQLLENDTFSQYFHYEVNAYAGYANLALRNRRRGIFHLKKVSDLFDPKVDWGIYNFFCNEIGNIYLKLYGLGQAPLDSAAIYFSKAYTVLKGKVQTDPIPFGKTLLMLGKVDFFRNRLDEAKLKFEKAYTLYSSSDQKESVEYSDLTNFLGAIFDHSKEHDIAYHYYN